MLSPLQKRTATFLPLLALLACSVCANPAVGEPPVAAAAAAVAAKIDASILPATEEAFFESCPQGSDWVKFSGSCYWWSRNAVDYWYVAEQKCKAFGGHLASISNSFNNSFISKLTYCRSAWLGRYAVNIDLLNQPSNYRWTDGTVSSYHAHNFSRARDIHHPLISIEDQQWHNNVYHQQQPYVCQVNTPQRNNSCDCPTGWRQLDGHCYFMPGFEATYIEADFYCRGRNAYVASIHTNRTLRAMSLLDIDSAGCPPRTWIGLLKLNPCRVDFSTGAKICYRWSDRTGDYSGFPAWQVGNPSDDQVTNCVLLHNEEILTVPCYTRARFVCKKKV